MLRLTVLLCMAMIGALLVLGEDNGQMRPGIAKAVAEGRTPVILGKAEVAPVVTASAPTPAPEPVVKAPEVAPAVAVAPAAIPATYAEPERKVVQAVTDPVFTLSALGNELVPGEAEAPVDRVPAPATTAAEAPAAGEGTIWYVNASSVNVRAEPTTAAPVLGKLTNGEAALVITSVDGEWARIVIQGDGMEGFVALRYLSPEAP